MVRADKSLYVSLAERRCSKHIIRHRKYAAPEKREHANRTVCDAFKAVLFPIIRLFQRAQGFFSSSSFSSFP